MLSRSSFILLGAALLLLFPAAGLAESTFCECLLKRECLPPARALIICDYDGAVRHFTRESVLTRDARIEELSEQLRTGNAAERTTAITDLGTLGPLTPRVARAVIHALTHDASKWVRRAAARTLGKLQMGSAQSALRSAVRDGDKWVSHSAVEALRKISGSASFESF